MPSRSASPPVDCLPLLSARAHRTPRDGACFMELASLLAGERWSDHPRCTHPVLCVLARAINDACSDDGRQQLAPLVPDVIGRNADDPRITAALYQYCAEVCLRRNPTVTRLLMARRAAVERQDALQRGGRLRRLWTAVLEPDYRTAAGVSAAEAALLTAPLGDEALRDLLVGALSTYEAAAARTPHPDGVAGPPATATPSAPTEKRRNHA